MILSVYIYISTYLQITYDTNIAVEFDVFIPDIKLAFEYQGKQHYTWHYLYGNPETQQKRDENKKRVSTPYLIL